jgi:hypothetical protein
MPDMLMLAPPKVLAMKLGAIMGAMVTEMPHCATTRVMP